jgi:hypothetical protein
MQRQSVAKSRTTPLPANLKLHITYDTRFIAASEVVLAIWILETDQVFMRLHLVRGGTWFSGPEPLYCILCLTYVHSTRNIENGLTVSNCSDMPRKTVSMAMDLDGLTRLMATKISIHHASIFRPLRLSEPSNAALLTGIMQAFNTVHQTSLSPVTQGTHIVQWEHGTLK